MRAASGTATETRDVSTIRAIWAATAGKVDEPRELLTRFGADVEEPVRNRENPYCCGAGGGLLFADKEEEPGIAHQRRALQAASRRPAPARS